MHDTFRFEFSIDSNLDVTLVMIWVEGGEQAIVPREYWPAFGGSVAPEETERLARALFYRYDRKLKVKTAERKTAKIRKDRYYRQLKLGLGRHAVKGLWNSKTYYVEQKSDGKWTCTCPHWTFRLRRTGEKCKHIERFLDRQEHKQALSDFAREMDEIFEEDMKKYCGEEKTNELFNRYANT